MGMCPAARIMVAIPAFPSSAHIQTHEDYEDYEDYEDHGA